MGLDTFDVADTTLNGFVIVSWLSTIVSACLLVGLYRKQRFLFVKPSMILLGASHIVMQWPAAIFSGYFSEFLVRPYEFALIVHGFVLFGTIGSYFSFRKLAVGCWDRLSIQNEDARAARLTAIILLGLLALVAAGIYTSYVPIDCTGLHALLTNPAEASAIRELSLKLIDQPAPRYAFAILSATIAPVFTAAVAADCLTARRSIIVMTIFLVATLGMWMLALITGEKGVLTFLVLTLSACFVWKKRLSFAFYEWPILIGLSLFPAIVISIILSMPATNTSRSKAESCFDRSSAARTINKQDFFKTFAIPLSPDEPQPPSVTPETQPSSPPVPIETYRPPAEKNRTSPAPRPETEETAISRVLKSTTLKLNSAIEALERTSDGQITVVGNAYYQIRSVIYRATVVPLEVGSWYIHYTQTHGALGHEAIPAWRKISGAPPPTASIPNIVGRTYGPAYYGHDVPPTIYASAGYIFTYFAYFGPWAILIILVMLWATDLALLAVSYTSNTLFLPALAALSVSTLHFLDVDYTTVWITGGFGLIAVVGPIVSLLSDRVSNRFKNRGR